MGNWEVDDVWDWVVWISERLVLISGLMDWGFIRVIRGQGF